MGLSKFKIKYREFVDILRHEYHYIFHDGGVLLIVVGAILIYSTAYSFAYKNEADKTDDLYFKVSYNGQTYDFCVEYYLCGSDTDVYKAVESLKVGDVVDMQGFLYWYEGANPHITSVVVK